MLRTAGAQAARIGELWNLTLAICTVVFVAVLVALVLALWRSARGDARTPADVSGLHRIEHGPRRSVAAATGLSAAVLILLIAASVATDRALARLAVRDALHVEVTGNQWWWSVRYDDPDPSRVFTTANELHLPVGRPVILTLRSNDVIHSLWIPNLAGKKDLIPGRTATLVLRADRVGQYRAQCAEFCGMQHAWMALPVTAESSERYEAWAARQRQPAATPSDPVAQRGQQVFLNGSCAMCHTVMGTPAQGRRAPDLTHLASRPTLAAGALPNDAGRLAAWVLNPQAHKPGVYMPANPLPPDDLRSLVAYLGSLQ
jgi:cytochrome c oxidase subunit 2